MCVYFRYGFVHVARVGGVLATVTVTIERFVAVMFPLKRLRNAKPLLCICILGAIVYNIPRFFEIRCTSIYTDGQNTYTEKPSDQRPNNSFNTTMDIQNITKVRAYEIYTFSNYLT